MTVHKTSTRVLGSAALWAGLVLAACVPQPQIATAGVKKPAATKLAQSQPSKIPAMRSPALTPIPVSAETRAAQRDLAERIQSIGRGFNGDVGIAVRDIQNGWSTDFDGDSHFPQQSVSKFWVQLTALDKVDRGQLDLDKQVTIRTQDLTLFHQPIRAALKNGSFTTTIDDLIHRAIQQSDNTANDTVLRTVGGPDAVRSFLARKDIDGIRFGPGERPMQSEIAGLSWHSEYSRGRNFFDARSSLPMSKRKEALRTYLDDPVDGATPNGVVNALTRLKKGELLSPKSAEWLLGIMSHTRTGPQRLKGGLASGWSLAHKTGTGQILGATSTGYNDIGIITSPDGRSYAIATMIRETTAPIPTRMQMMQSVTRAVIDYDRRLGDD